MNETLDIFWIKNVGFGTKCSVALIEPFLAKIIEKLVVEISGKVIIFKKLIGKQINCIFSIKNNC